MPHHEDIKAWEDRADGTLVDNEAAMGADGLGMDAKSLEELVWNGLKESVDGGWRDLSEAEQLYYTWLHKYHGDPPDGTA